MQHEPHTPGPWTTEWRDQDDECGAGYYITRVNGTGRILAYVACAYEERNPMAANAARIVACVNACEGLDDPVRQIAERFANEIGADCAAWEETK